LSGKRKIEGCQIGGGLYNMGTSATGKRRYIGMQECRDTGRRNPPEAGLKIDD